MAGGRILRKWLDEVTFCAVDIETTGYHKKAEPVEIGMVKFDRKGPIARPFHRLIRPRHEVPSWIFKVHGISNAMLSGQPTPSQLRPNVKGYIRNCVLVMHGGRFDGRFLRRYFHIGARPWIETIDLSKRLWPNARSHKLRSVCRRLGISHRAHDALSDAQATSRILVEFLKKFRRYKQLKDLQEEGLLKYLHA